MVLGDLIFRSLWGLGMLPAEIHCSACVVFEGFPQLGVPSIMENQMEKKMENEMETGFI